MSIEAIANIASTTAAANVASRAELVAPSTSHVEIPPPAAGPPETAAPQAATVTTLSDAARAQQAADEQAARDAADQAVLGAATPASTSVVTTLVYRDWAAGAPAVGNGAVQEALSALDEASRENLRVVADALRAREDRAAQQQQAVEDVAALAEQQRDASVLLAINAEIRLAYGALPSPLTGDPVLREPGQVDVIA